MPAEPPANAAPHLTLHLGGAFAAFANGAEITGISRRGQALLAYLSQQPRMRAERARLADLLWSDRSDDQARASPRQELASQRKQLPHDILYANRQHVWLDSDNVRASRDPDPEFMDGFDLPS